MNILPLTVVPLKRIATNLYNCLSYKSVCMKFNPHHRPYFESNKFIPPNYDIYKQISLQNSQLATTPTKTSEIQQIVE
jgi:hypothetical protein